jgi:hypothetical protein
LHRTDTVCSHVGTNRKQPALTYPGPAPWESGWREPNAHASLASRHAAHLLGSGGMRSAPCRLRQKHRGTVRRLGGPAASPACHGISQPPHLQTHVPPAVSRPSAAEPSPFVHASGHRAISHFCPKAPRSVRVSEEPWTSSELRPRGELLRTCSSANKLCITAAVARRCRPHQPTPGQKCAFRPLGVRPGVHTAVLTSKRSQTGAAMFHVKQNARLAVRAPRTAMVALKTRRRTPAVRFY